jgi:hypothetical protein
MISKWDNPRFWRRYQRNYYRKNKKRLQKLNRIAWRKRMKDPAKRLHYNARMVTWRKAGKNKRKLSNVPGPRVLRHRLLKLEVIRRYGGKCACCGEREPAFLQIDHKDNQGHKHFRGKSKNRLTGSRLYCWLRLKGWPKKNFQLLCALCNVAKEMYGICPHKSRIKGDAFILGSHAIRTGRKFIGKRRTP